MISRGGMLHDLGKLVDHGHHPAEAGAGSPTEEFAIIRTHPVVGDKILKPLRFLAREA